MSATSAMSSGHVQSDRLTALADSSRWLLIALAAHHGSRAPFLAALIAAVKVRAAARVLAATLRAVARVLASYACRPVAQRRAPAPPCCVRHAGDHGFIITRKTYTGRVGGEDCQTNTLAR